MICGRASPWGGFVGLAYATLRLSRESDHEALSESRCLRPAVDTARVRQRLSQGFWLSPGIYLGTSWSY